MSTPMLCPSVLFRTLLWILLASVIARGQANAADWPMWRHDAKRTAASPHALPAKLRLQWLHQYPAPHRCWQEPLNQQRMSFDRCYEPIVVGDTLYFGSGGDDCLIALDAKSGRERWRSYANGPVRLPPAAWQGKVYFSSDDGCLYCVDGKTGKRLWRFRGAPSHRKLLGNERLISAWPARGGPVVVDGTVYFAAGIWPFMGTFLHALDASSGKARWTNDGSGSTFIVQPHRAPSFAGVGPQGPMVVSGNYLLVPGGRTVPAAYDRRTGKFLYFNVEGYRKGGPVTHRIAYRRMRYTGNSTVAAIGRFYFTRPYMFDVSTGADLMRIGNPPLVLTESTIYQAGNPLKAYALGSFQAQPRRSARTVQEHTMDTLWSAPFIEAGAAIKAGTRLYATGKNVVAALQLPTKTAPARLVWTKAIDGDGASLIAAGGRLFVSTLEGRIYCFGAENVKNPKKLAAASEAKPPSLESSRVAKRLLKSAGASEGYCLVFGSGNFDAIEALASLSKLRIIVLEPQIDRVEQLRRRLQSSGMYGPRLSVVHFDSETERLPPYLANLIICEDVSRAGFRDARQFVERTSPCLRPYGGVAFLTLSAKEHQALRDSPLMARLQEQSMEFRSQDGFSIVERRGKLPGAGSWTHNYGDAGNTTVSDDSLVKLPLGVLWFGGSSHDATLPRHGRPPAPQVLDGRIIMEGPNGLRAMDVYTGRVLWDARLPELGKFFDTVIHQPGALAVGGNYVTKRDGIYVAYKNVCVQLDPASGKALSQFKLPMIDKAVPAWGYINVVGDYLIAGAGPNRFEGSKGLPGSSGNLDFTSSKQLVVLDRRTGDVVWRRVAAFAFAHNTIALGGDKLFCIDYLIRRDLARLKRRGRKASAAPKLLALDLRTGKEIWSNDKAIGGQWLGYSAKHDVLLLCSGSRASAFRGQDGKLLWHERGNFGNYRPMLHDQTIITQDRAYNLLTGQPKLMEDPITGKEIPWIYKRNGEVGCTNAVACRNLITFRSGATGYFDLERGRGMGTFGGFRPSCTNNVIAADGLLLAPDYTRTCKCAYQNQTSLALIHMPEIETWTEFAYPAGGGRVRRLGINLGAPGDRRAQDGTMWIEYPVVGGRSPDVAVTAQPSSLETFRVHEWRLRDKGHSWVAASGVEGITSLKVRLVSEGAKKATDAPYSVSLYFAELRGAKVGERVFNVLIQGRTVLSRFDVIKESGGASRAIIKRFDGIKPGHELTIALQAAGPNVRPPILSGIEIKQQGP